MDTVTVTVAAECGEEVTLNIPAHFVYTPVYWWNNGMHQEAYAQNEHLTPEEYANAMPLDGYGQGQVYALLTGE